jgi:predicted chitinase
MKKGVKAITGNTTLQSGNWENFHVSDWYKGTPMEFRNEAHVKWAVYHLENGVTPVKVLEKDQGHFRFKSKAVGEKFLIVAYIFEPELSTGLEITVLDNNVPEILSIKISDINDQPFEGPIYTGQVINCHASTVGMVGHHVVFSLWEDNDQDSTNNDDNSKHRLVQEKITRAGSLGVAHAQFQVASDFTKLAEAAMGNGSAMKQYYITVFAMGLLKPDAGTKLIYPDERKAITKDHLAGKKPEKDQVPPYKERIVLKEKGEKKTVKTSSYSTQHSTTKKITNVLLLDEKYKPINNTFNGKTLIVYIQSQGLINHKIQFKLYEHDYGSANDILLNQEYTITGDNCKIIVHLDRIPRKRGGEFMEEGFEQEIFADIEVKELQKHIVSKKIDVDAGVFKVDVDKTNKKSYAEVGEKAEKKDGKNNDCPRCNEDFKYSDIVKIFPSASKNKDLAEKLIIEINKLKEKYEINSCIRKAHLINQFGSETGFHTLIEGIDGYSVATLTSLFGYFKRHPAEAKTYKGNLREIALRAYGLRKVDKESDIVSCSVKPGGKCNDLGNETMEEGYTYIGRGLIQLTGKYNYSQINIDFKKAFPNKGDLVKNPELLEQPEYATMSAYSYWINNKLNAKADVGSNGSHVDEITKIINKNLDQSHYKKRRDSFEIAKEVYRLGECKNLISTSTSSETVTIRLVRKWQTTKSTIGEFTIDGSDIKGFILEEKGPDTTVSGKEQRIPIGTYNLVWHSGTKFKNVLKLHNSAVSINRAILIHPGNSAENTEGCLLPGSSKSTDWVSGSKDKVKEINDYVNSVGIENAKIIITEKYE